ncbi:MAG: hypothetical protein COA44_02280 [Arcobacter sp.]|nr:MAG: hypothetical protein COA44_02280 [Arcobacter sp.]
MDIELGIIIIKEVARENGFKITDGTSSFQIFKDRVHPESFKVQKKNDDLLIYQWEDEDYGKNCIYSLRSLNDIVKFCNVLIASTDIRGGRTKD